MKNKKAQKLLGEHGVELIIAVLSLVILIYLGFSLYGFFIGEDTEERQAEASLQKIVDKINSLEQGQKVDFQVFNPLKWSLGFISSLDGDNPCEEGKSCVCLCEGNLLKEDCIYYKNTVCSNLNSKVINRVNYYIEGPLFLEAELNGNEIIIKQK